jgi:hypothetical protein
MDGNRVGGYFMEKKTLIMANENIIMASKTLLWQTRKIYMEQEKEETICVK